MSFIRYATLATVLSFAGICAAQDKDDAKVVEPKSAEPTVESLLNDWSKVSKECKSLDVKFVRIVYDCSESHLGHDLVGHADDGRFYIEASGLGVYKFGDKFSVIRQPDKMLCLDFERKEYLQVENAQIEEAKKTVLELLSQKRGFWENCQLAWLRISLMAPQDRLPFYLMTDIKAFQARFDLSLSETEGHQRLLIAKSKAPDTDEHRQLAFLFDDPKSLSPHLPLAMRQSNRYGEMTTHLFKSPCLNITPSEKEEIMNPNIDKLPAEWKRLFSS